jgi:hypothetical protein
MPQSLQAIQKESECRLRANKLDLDASYIKKSISEDVLGFFMIYSIFLFSSRATHKTI